MNERTVNKEGYKTAKTIDGAESLTSAHLSAVPQDLEGGPCAVWLHGGAQLGYLIGCISCFSQRSLLLQIILRGYPVIGSELGCTLTRTINFVKKFIAHVLLSGIST